MPVAELLPLEGLLAEKAKRNLSDFIRLAWPIIEPQNRYLPNWHIEAIAEHLQAINRRQIKRLIINMPPRSMKSIAVSVTWPAWTWIQNPSERFMYASYSSSLSLKHSVDRRTVIKSDWYQNNWGHIFQLSQQQDQKSEFVNSHRGVMLATSVGGSATGKGGGILVGDDLLDPGQAVSDAERANANLFFDRTFFGRLDDPIRDAIVLVMQRLHEDDPTGHALATGKWEHLVLPMEYDGRKSVTSLGWTDPRTEIGQLLHPARFGREEVEAYKTRLGAYAYAGQYQQIPAPDEGAMLRRAWWKYYTEDPRHMVFDEVIQSWDCIFRRSDSSDYVVGTVWGRIGARKYLLDLDRGRYDFVDTCKAIRNMAKKWPQARAILIEDKANGPAIIRTLETEISGIIAIDPKGGKDSRAYAVAPQIEAGNVFLPANAIFTENFVQECAIFPNGTNDDQVDSMSQALLRLQESDRSALLPEFSRALHVVKAKLEPWFERWLSLWWSQSGCCAHWFAADQDGIIHVYRELAVSGASAADFGSELAHESSYELAQNQILTVYAPESCFDKHLPTHSIARQIAIGIEKALGDAAAFLWEYSDDETGLGPDLALASLQARRSKALGARLMLQHTNGEEASAWEYLRGLLNPPRLVQAPTLTWDRELAMKMVEDGSPEGLKEYAAYLAAVEGKTAEMKIGCYFAPDCELTIQALSAGARDPKHEGLPAPNPYQPVLSSLAMGLLGHRDQKSKIPLKQFVEQRLQNITDPMARSMAARKAEADYKAQSKTNGVTFRRLNRRGRGDEN